MKSVTIIGGGFSGTMTAIHLLRMAQQPLNVYLINKDYATAKGIAYGTKKDYLLLNVRAGKMSAFPDEPDHFVNWIRNNPGLKQYDTPSLPGTFMPRKVYGDYINALWQKHLSNPGYNTITVINDEAIGLEQIEDKWVVKCRHWRYQAIESETVVLATGNSVPGNPFTKKQSTVTTYLYQNNPWNDAILDNLRGDEDIVFIGTGLTTIDHLITLEHRGHSGKIFVISAKGNLPIKQELPGHYPDFTDELKGKTLIEMFGVFKKHFRNIQQQGKSIETLIAAIRSYIPELWHSLSLSDKKQFIRHLGHWWNMARHGIPQEAGNVIEQQLQRKQLTVLKGRPYSVLEIGDRLNFIYKDTTNTTGVLTVHKVVNCTGPQSDITKECTPLFKNLVNNSWIKQDESGLGIKADKTGRVYTAPHNFSNLYAIGNLLKGVLWESVAVPELSAQAQDLAKNITASLKPDNAGAHVRRVNFSH